MSYFSSWFNKTIGGASQSPSGTPIKPRIASVFQPVHPRVPSPELPCILPTSNKKRKYSEMEESTTSTSSLPHFPRAPSPVPTLIIDEEQSEKVERIKKMGVKVRDFIDEQPLSQTPEVYRLAIPDLANWDAYLRKRYQQPFRERGLALGPTGGHGKVLRRLLDLGWITEEEREINFQPNDIAALMAYDNSPSSSYPWRIPHGLEKPTPLERRDAWRSRFPPRSDDISEALIFSSTPITDEEEAEHRDKRAKTDELPSSTPPLNKQPTSGGTPPQPLMTRARRGALVRTKTMMTLF
jgi:hypothetical protein